MPGNDCDDRYWSMMFFSRIVPSESDNHRMYQPHTFSCQSIPADWHIAAPRFPRWNPQAVKIVGRASADWLSRISNCWKGRGTVIARRSPGERVSRQIYQKHLPHALPGLINSSRKIAREALRNTNFPGPRRSSTANTSIRSPKANFPLTNPSQPTFPPTNTPTHRKYGDQRRIPSLRRGLSSPVSRHPGPGQAR
jgi:hypothetical protein